MNRFEIITPADIRHASRMLADPGHAALAGGVDLLDLLKQNLAAPQSLVNLKGLKGIDAIESTPDGGVKIGALVRLHEIATDVRVNQHYAAVAQAAGEAATPQIRNLATAGGNLLQRPRCWYFRNPEIVCLKKGGNRCYAVGGLNRYHAILGGGPSFIVHPSNLAPALIAFAASVHLVSPASERTVELEQFFTLPKVDVARENDLKSGEILTAVIIPPAPRGAGSAYIEAREKQSFDWPLVSAAVVVATDGTRVREARVVMGAVAPIPWRAPAAEKTLIGASLDRDHALRAAEAALAGAAPLADNGYKVPMAKALVRRAILRAGGVEENA
ncbi:MAG: FAD binding domain-containing protein [Candidatus Binataceae bacterium]